MGLRSTLKAGVDLAFDAVGDLKRVVTYHSVTGPPVYDVETGTTSTPATNYTLRRVVITSFTQTEIDNDPSLLTSEKMIFPHDDLPVEPKPNDTVTDDEGRVWEIVRLLSVPGKLINKLQVRTTR
jgi:hypothetical protein